MTSESTTQILLSELPKLLKQIKAAALPDQYAYCVFHWRPLGPGFSQCAADFNDLRMLCEMQSIKFDIQLAKILTRKKTSMLRDLGFNPPRRERPNWYQYIPIESDTSYDKIAETLSNAMTKVYGYVETMPLYADCILPGLVY
jgi:hypothetical protein